MHPTFASSVSVDTDLSKNSIPQHKSGFMCLVADAKSRIKEISAHDLAGQLTNPSLCLIDVRELDEYKQGAIPHAIHLSKGVIERDIENKIPDKHAQIVVYCSGGFRSCLVADNLQKMHYQHIASLVGGIRAWLEAGFALTNF